MEVRLSSQFRRIVRAGSVLSLAFVTGFVMQNGPLVEARLSVLFGGTAKPPRIVEAEAEALHTNGLRNDTARPGNLGTHEIRARFDDADSLPLDSGTTPRAINSRSSDHLPEISARGNACLPDLTLDPVENAMIEVSLTAACHRGAPVTLHHAGFRVTQRLNGDGTLTTLLPALQADARVMADLGDGVRTEQPVGIEGLPAKGRLVLFWKGGADLSLHAFEDGASFGDPGHITERHGRMRRLGTEEVVNGWRAIVYDTPRSDDEPLEADAVTEVTFTLQAGILAATCGRRVAAEFIAKAPGAARVRDAVPVVLPLPGCGAMGSQALLPEILPPMTLPVASGRQELLSLQK